MDWLLIYLISSTEWWVLSRSFISLCRYPTGHIGKFAITYSIRLLSSCSLLFGWLCLWFVSSWKFKGKASLKKFKFSCILLYCYAYVVFLFQFLLISIMNVLKQLLSSLLLLNRHSLHSLKWKMMLRKLEGSEITWWRKRKIKHSKYWKQRRKFCDNFIPVYPSNQFRVNYPLYNNEF